MPNVLISSEIGSEWRVIFGHPQPIGCMGICVLSVVRGSELKGSNVYLHTVKKKSVNFSLHSKGTCPWIAFAQNFFGIKKKLNGIRWANNL